MIWDINASAINSQPRTIDFEDSEINKKIIPILLLKCSPTESATDGNIRIRYIVPYGTRSAGLRSKKKATIVKYKKKPSNGGITYSAMSLEYNNLEKMMLFLIQLIVYHSYIQ